MSSVWGGQSTFHAHKMTHFQSTFNVLCNWILLGEMAKATCKRWLKLIETASFEVCKALYSLSAGQGS